MALSLGKLTILVGAGIFGSILAKEGRMPEVPNFISGAFKIALKQIRSDSSSSVNKPRNDSLMEQVNSLRQEIEMLSINRPITIVSTSEKGATKYGVVVIVVVVGYGYVWLKGWKLPDMMFATRRGLSDACNTIAHQLENVYSSIKKTRSELSTDIDRVDSSLNEVARLTSDTQERVTELRDESARIGYSFRTVRNVVETLEEKISRIEGKQDLTTLGVKRLVDIASNMEINQNMQATSSNSRIAFTSQIGSLPPPSPTSYEQSTPFEGSFEVRRSRQDTSSASTSGQQRNSGISGVVDVSSSSNGTSGVEEAKNAGSSWFGPAFLSRTRSATNALLQRTGSSKQQA